MHLVRQRRQCAWNIIPVIIKALAVIAKSGLTQAGDTR